MSPIGSPPDEVSLRDLILTLKGDRTYQKLEEDSGGVVKAQRWNQITNGIRLSEFPEPRTLEAMARALNVNVEVVLLAFARALGLQVSRSRSLFAELLPPIADELTEQQQGAILALIRSMNPPPADSADSSTGDDGGTLVGDKNSSGAVYGAKKPPARKKGERARTRK